MTNRPYWVLWAGDQGQILSPALQEDLKSPAKNSGLRLDLRLLARRRPLRGPVHKLLWLKPRPGGNTGL